MTRSRLIAGTAACAFGLIAQAQNTSVGIFESQIGVGATRHAGKADFNASRHTYTISGGGENMWFTNDAFHFVWKKISGDVTLAADVSFLTRGGNAHRKACLLIRQSLDPDSAYADAALHGDGLTSLQYREARSAPTREIQANVSTPKRLRCPSLARARTCTRPAAHSD
jgi:hypothetical protein